MTLKTATIVLALTLLSSCFKTKTTVNIPANFSGPKDGTGSVPPVGDLPPGALNSYDLQLSWSRPQFRTNCDPLPLNEIGGYYVNFGLETKTYNPAIDINDNSATAHDLTLYGDGTYYFSLQAYDTDGQSSDYSDELILQCENNTCNDITPPGGSPPISCPVSPIANSSDLKNTEVKSAFTFKLKKSDKNIKPPKNKKVAKANCPLFLEEYVKSKKFPFSEGSLTVSLAARNNRKIMCNWSRYRKKGTVPETKIGYRRGIISAPIFIKGDAIKEDEKVKVVSNSESNVFFIPYDISEIPVNKKIELMKAITGKTLKEKKINKILEEVPSFARNEYVSGGSSFNEQRVQTNFALIDNNIYAGVNFTFLPLCDEITIKDKKCYDLPELTNATEDQSKFLKRNIKNKKLPVIAISISNKKDIDAFRRLYNDKLLNIDIFYTKKIADNKEIYFSQNLNRPEDQNKRPSYLSIREKQQNKLNIAKIAFKFDHTKNKVSAANYVLNLLKQKEVTTEQITAQMPELLELLNSILTRKYEKGTELKVLSMEILNFIFTKENQNLDEHPRAKVANIYKQIIDSSMYGSKKIALDTSFMLSETEFTDQEITTIIESSKILRNSQINPNKALEISYKLYKKYGFVTVNKTVKYLLDRIAYMAGTILNMDDTYEFTTDKIVETVEKWTFEFDYTKEQESMANQLYNSFSSTYDYRDDDYRFAYIQLAMEKIEKYLFDRKFTQEDANAFKQMFKFTMDKNGLYTFKYLDALEITEDYLFNHKLSLHDVNLMKNSFNWLMSKSGPFIQDRDKAKKIMDEFFLRGKSMQDRFHMLYFVFDSLFRDFEDKSVNRIGIAFDHCLEIVRDLTNTRELVQHLSNVQAFITYQFYKTKDIEFRASTASKIVFTHEITSHEFQNLRKIYNQLKDNGELPEVALNKAINKTISERK